MNLFFRILLAVYAVCLTVISFITMVIYFKHDVLKSIYNYVKDNVFTNYVASFIMFIVAFIFFLTSGIFLLSGLRSNKDKKAVSKYTNIGEIKISLNSIENIALAASRRLNGVRETKAYVRKLGDSVSIVIRAVVQAEINIPALSEDIQLRVKNSIEDSSGIKVSDVKVVVENIFTGYKSRVE